MTEVFDPVTLTYVEQGVLTLKEEFRGIFSEATVDRYFK